MNRGLNLKRHTIAKFLTFPLRFPFNESIRFLSSFLRHLLFKSIRFMDSLVFPSASEDADDVFTLFDHSFSPLQQPSLSNSTEPLFLVSFRWWKEAREAVCSGGDGVLYNGTAQLTGAGEDEEKKAGMAAGRRDSKILVSMKREGEAKISEEERVSSEGDFALVSEWMFLTALKWHNDLTGVESFLPDEDSTHDLFSLQIRLLCVLETNSLVIKISQKDNQFGAFNTAYNIFCNEPRSLRIWDFSEQTNQLFTNKRKLFRDSGLLDEEIILELQVYGFSYSIKTREKGKEDMMAEQSMSDVPSFSGSLNMNGGVDKVNLYSRDEQSSALGRGYGRIPPLGLTGLYNLGNTCFMNSAIQCLVHTPKLVDYFLGDFRKDLNFENSLGTHLAIAFGDLSRKLWAPRTTPVSPTMFKSTLASFAPQFSGYNQHDSQELLAFLLDGLHEDLNRVKHKPYAELKDEDDRPDVVVADEYWRNHISRNDSIIVDLCQGQYRSSLACPVCKKLSITFDPFMYLSLPLPSTTLRKMTLTVVSTEGPTLPYPITVSVPNNGSLEDLVQALGTACLLREDEMLLIAEIYNHSIIRILDDPHDSVDLIRDNDRLVAYRLAKDTDGTPLVEFMHQPKEKLYIHAFPSFEKFGIPLLARMTDFSKGSEIYKQFLKLIDPYLMQADDSSIDSDITQNIAHEEEEMEDVVLDSDANLDSESANDLDSISDFEFYLDSGNFLASRIKIQMDEPVPISKSKRLIKVLVSWPKKMIEDYDTSILSLLRDVCEPTLKKPRESVSLYKCVDAFLKEEPLGPEDMWYCPHCKDHRQASKKLDLWRLPEILVIHLKRFSYNQYFKNKLETFVDFPIDDFDLSSYTFDKNKFCHHYALYAVSNHYGGMGGGHYTAFVQLGNNRWCEFDDNNVFPVDWEKIKTSAAYVLFYRRISLNDIE
ncbi:ubiquitin carboxyl-terminal hydrolase 8-like [Olea europaea subsp. europaea]|uniref:Ubiquitin carboxyl-terminal hydrolase n=1 Tax=Olea europaea subsp. europaea TaxID=158383 RepID=A0A8S0RN14_OLEEU|nr:ubiquitin carboxyl-terminal hydrolase 8-like [Olea europaea subsp. europaea]